jgi:putative protein kinase ArgK-like GTPase of G3E family
MITRPLSRTFPEGGAQHRIGLLGVEGNGRSVVVGAACAGFNPAGLSASGPESEFETSPMGS